MPARPRRFARQRARPRPGAPAACAGSRRGAHPPTRSKPSSRACTPRSLVVRGEMHALRERLHGALAQEVGEFLDLHALLLDDPELLHGLDELIRTGRYTADYALRLQRDRIAAVFDRHGRCLPAQPHRRHRPGDRPHPCRPAPPRPPTCEGVAGEILVTDNVAPAELAQLQAQGVMAVVTAGGSALSHSAILARSLHLPLVVGAAQALQKINDGDVLVVDGGSGMVVRRTGCRRPARAPRAHARARARAQAAQPPAPRTDRARSTASTSSCAPTPNRARTSPRRMRWAPRASACTAPNSCSCSATSCRTRKRSSAPIATSCWA